MFYFYNYCCLIRLALLNALTRYSKEIFQGDFYCSRKNKKNFNHYFRTSNKTQGLINLINNIPTYISVLVSSVAPSAPILHGGQLYVDVLWGASSPFGTGCGFRKGWSNNEVVFRARMGSPLDPGFRL